MEDFPLVLDDFVEQISYRKHCRTIGEVLDWVHENINSVIETRIIKEVLGGKDPRFEYQNVFSSQEDSEEGS